MIGKTASVLANNIPTRQVTKMHDSERLNRRTAVVTGATSGFGFGIGKVLAAKGANVMLNGLGDAVDIDHAMQEVGKRATGGIGFSPANMLEPAEIEKMIHRAVDRFGSIDILVNNAGIQYVSPIGDFPFDK
jgi:3-hydroxybutyrate dehydrogenase